MCAIHLIGQRYVIRSAARVLRELCVSSNADQARPARSGFDAEYHCQARVDTEGIWAFHHRQVGGIWHVDIAPDLPLKGHIIPVVLICRLARSHAVDAAYARHAGPVVWLMAFNRTAASVSLRIYPCIPWRRLTRRQAQT